MILYYSNLSSEQSKIDAVLRSILLEIAITLTPKTSHQQQKRHQSFIIYRKRSTTTLCSKF